MYSKDTEEEEPLLDENESLAKKIRKYLDKMENHRRSEPLSKIKLDAKELPRRKEAKKKVPGLLRLNLEIAANRAKFI